MVSTASLLRHRQLGKVVKNKPASSLVVFLAKALNGTPPPLCGRQVAQTYRKWQLPSECGRPVQDIAVQFAFSRKNDKYGKYKKSDKIAKGSTVHVVSITKKLRLITTITWFTVGWCTVCRKLRKPIVR